MCLLGITLWVQFVLRLRVAMMAVVFRLLMSMVTAMMPFPFVYVIVIPVVLSRIWKNMLFTAHLVSITIQVS